MAKFIIRVMFVLICIGIGAAFYPSIIRNESVDMQMLGATIGLGTAIIILCTEIAMARKFIQTVPTIMISLIFGFIVANLFLQALMLVPAIRDAAEVSRDYKNGLNTIVVLTFTYISVMMILQTKDEWKFIIPYVEFKCTQKGPSSIILDTSVIIDGRIVDILKTGAIDNHIIIPSFVTRELQAVADSSDRLKRRRGRRGLDALNAIKNDKAIDSAIKDAQYSGVRAVDDKLIRLAKDTGAKIMTIDFNLIKVAAFQDVGVININDLANSLKPTILPGEEIKLSMVRAGEEPNQAIGYLDDGTMVVVDDAKDKIGVAVEIVITSVHQSSAGKMFFGRVKGRNKK